MDKVTMRSPEGEVREVEANPQVLTPLMVAGWVQVIEKKEEKDARG